MLFSVSGPVFEIYLNIFMTFFVGGAFVTHDFPCWRSVGYPLGYLFLVVISLSAQLCLYGMHAYFTK